MTAGPTRKTRTETRQRTGIARREALGFCAVWLGGALSASVTRAALGAPAANAAARPALTTAARASIAALADLILPATATPGAVEAGVPAFIESLLAGWYRPEERDRFLAGLDWLERTCIETAGEPFAHAPRAAQTAVLDAAVRGTDAPHRFFGMAREAVVVGFFTSELGAREVLTYVPVPGRYDGEFPMAQVTGHWSS